VERKGKVYFYSRGARQTSSVAEQAAEKVGIRFPAPEGASDFEEVTASLRRCPDTNPEFFRSL
jgi:hypothetical protein